MRTSEGSDLFFKMSTGYVKEVESQNTLNMKYSHNHTHTGMLCCLVPVVGTIFGSNENLDVGPTWLRQDTRVLSTDPCLLSPSCLLQSCCEAWSLHAYIVVVSCPNF